MKRLLHFLAGKYLWTPRILEALASSLALLLWFDIDWCMATTFRAMSDPLLWINTVAATLTLTLPYVATRRVWVHVAVLAVAFGICEANLMYCRTYLTAIPPDSYLLAGNLSDFTASVADSIRWLDWIGLLIVVDTAIVMRRMPSIRPGRRAFMRLSSLTLLICSVSAIWIAARGGFFAAYDKLIQSCYYSTCGVPTYTVAGHVAYCLLDARRRDGADPRTEIDRWIAEHDSIIPVKPLPEGAAPRRNLVLIICESLESWPLEAEIGGKEITPYLNSLLRDSTAFYAPDVLTQVASGRSIDCQLLIHSGLLPTVGSVYSMKYPSATYPSLNKALIGNPAKLSDGSFLRQSVGLLDQGEIWPEGASRMLTFITYSGHNPFRLPDNLRDPEFDISGEGLPQRLADYITMAHYTDSQLHTLIHWVRSRPDYGETLIVITGDHEGLAGDRREFAKASPLVSAGQYTPFIVLNSPVAGRVGSVAGQIDIYPTLLDMLGLADYGWRGVGQSLLDPDRGAYAVSMMTGEKSGDSTTLAPGQLQLLRSARRVSDAAIRSDYFKNETDL